MTACLMARAWPHAVVTVIESPEIGIVGVGEGSTPQLRTFFARLGIAEADWMPHANATYKAGIAFHGWSARTPAYFHPFQTAIDGFTAPAFFESTRARRAGLDVPAHPDRFFVPAWLAEHRRAPTAPEHFPFDIGYGYHFDAHLIGVVLRDHAVGRLGVHHLQRRMTQVLLAASGDVEALILEGGETFAADLFVDGSGFRSAIAQTAMHVPFHAFGNNLFNDRAVTIPTPADPSGTNAHTSATALSAGWAWDIPLTNRTGNGYVYSSRYLSPDAAEAELRAHLGAAAGDTPARHLEMKVGRIATTWTRNCLAVGLAQGFIEPLEATALHIVQSTVDGFIEAYETGDFGAAKRDEFNARIAARYEGIRDYIVCHYRVNTRGDTEYWRDNATNPALSDTLKAVLTAWFTGQDLDAEVARLKIGSYYSALSWHCLLAGYGTFPDDSRLHALAQPGPDLVAINDFVRRCGLNFPDHREALARLRG
jgi:hypothetical protein